MLKRVIGLAVALSLMGTAAQSQDQASRWGDDDQAGASNLMTPERAMEAVKLIKTGNVVALGRTYEPEMPLFGHRVFGLRGTTGYAGGPFGDNKVVWMDDFLATEIGQVGTQFDGLGHIGFGETGTFYNGLKADDIFGPTGLQKLG